MGQIQRYDAVKFGNPDNWHATLSPDDNGSAVLYADHLEAMAAKHKQAIADVDEEIREVKFISRNFLDERLTVWKRILARLEAHRAELARGMKEKVTDGAK